ncbi:hypothetical protein D3C72_648260 [compost metagenome]
MPRNPQGAVRVEHLRAVRPTREAHQHLGLNARARVDLRGDQVQIAARPQARARLVVVVGQKAQVARAVQRHPVKAGTRHGQHAAHAAVDRALRAEGQAVAHFQQAARAHRERALAHILRVAEQDARPDDAVGRGVFSRTRQPHRGGREVDLGRYVGLLGGKRIPLRRQRKRAGVQAQALPHRHVDVTVERHQAVGQQPQVIEASARQQARRIQTRLAVTQAVVGFARHQARGKRFARARRQHHFARHLHGLARQALAPGAVQRRLKRDIQRAACRARAARACDERAVQMQPVIGTERDSPAVAVQPRRTNTIHIHGRAGAGGVQHRAGTHDDIQVG